MLVVVILPIKKFSKSTFFGENDKGYYCNSYNIQSFNEDVISEYSTKSKSKLVNSNINLINQPQKIAKQNNTELKRMLIDSVESMNDKEIEIIHSALQSAGDQNVINQYLENNTGELNQTNLKQLNQLNGEDCEDQYNEENELEEEIDDSGRIVNAYTLFILVYL